MKKKWKWNVMKKKWKLIVGLEINAQVVTFVKAKLFSHLPKEVLRWHCSGHGNLRTDFNIIVIGIVHCDIQVRAVSAVGLNSNGGKIFSFVSVTTFIERNGSSFSFVLIAGIVITFKWIRIWSQCVRSTRRTSSWCGVNAGTVELKSSESKSAIKSISPFELEFYTISFVYTHARIWIEVFEITIVVDYDQTLNF